MPGLLIHDGYTRDGVIPEKKPYPAIRFKYRPALPDQMNEWRMTPATSGKEITDALIKVLTKCMISWDVTEQAGVLKIILGRPENMKDIDDATIVTVPIAAATLRCLPDLTLKNIFDVVSGYGPAEQEADVKN
jgi:hypothetical protein